MATGIRHLTRHMGGSWDSAWAILLRRVDRRGDGRTFEMLLLALGCLLGPERARELNLLIAKLQVSLDEYASVVKLLLRLAKVESSKVAEPGSVARELFYRNGLRSSSTDPSTFFRTPIKMAPCSNPLVLSLGELFVRRCPSTPISKQRVLTSVRTLRYGRIIYCDADSRAAFRSTIQAVVMRSIGDLALLPDAAQQYNARFYPSATVSLCPIARNCVLSLQAYSTHRPTASACGRVQCMLHDAARDLSQIEQFVLWLGEQQPTHRALARSLALPGRPLDQIRSAALALPLSDDSRSLQSLVELDAKCAPLRTSIRRLWAMCRALETSTGSELLSSLYMQATRCRDWWADLEYACWPLVDGIRQWLSSGSIDTRVADFFSEDCAAPAGWESLPAQPGWANRITLRFPSWIPQSLWIPIKETGVLLRFIALKTREQVPGEVEMDWSDCSWAGWDATFGTCGRMFGLAGASCPSLELAFESASWGTSQVESDPRGVKRDANHNEKRELLPTAAEVYRRRLEESRLAERAKMHKYRLMLDEQVAQKIKERLGRAAAVEEEERFLLSPKIARHGYGAEEEDRLLRREARYLGWRLGRLALDARRVEFERQWEAQEARGSVGYAWWYLAPSTLANRVACVGAGMTFFRCYGPLRVPGVRPEAQREPQPAIAQAPAAAAPAVASAFDSSGYLSTLETQPMAETRSVPRESVCAILSSAGVCGALTQASVPPPPLRDGAPIAQRPNPTWDSSGVQGAWAAEPVEPARHLFSLVEEPEKKDTTVSKVEEVDDDRAVASILLGQAYTHAVATSAAPKEPWVARRLYESEAPIDIRLEQRVIGPLRRHVLAMERTLWAQLSAQWDAVGHVKSLWRAAFFFENKVETLLARVIELWRCNLGVGVDMATFGFRMDSLFRSMQWDDPYIHAIQYTFAPGDAVAFHEESEDGVCAIASLIERLQLTFHKDHAPWGALFSSHALDMANSLFRHLATVKIAHADLRRIWVGLQTTRTCPSEIATHLCLLHHDLMNTVTQLDGFCSHVLAAAFVYMSDPQRARSLSEWQRWCGEQLERCLDLCFLTPRGALIADALGDILALCGRLHTICMRDALTMDGLRWYEDVLGKRRRTLRKIGAVSRWGWDASQRHFLLTA